MAARPPYPTLAVRARYRRIAIAILSMWFFPAAEAMQPDSLYHPIILSATTTVVLTGLDLSIDQLIQIARYGAKVALSAAAEQQEADNYGLLLEAQAEAIPVYNLNRRGGLGRSIQTLTGDPLSDSNRTLIERRELEAFEAGVTSGDGPEISKEEIVRATMAIRANQLVHETPSPQLSRLLLNLLNSDLTPVMQSRGTVGESDWNVLPNIGAAMVGKGEAYYHGIRMSAASALKKAGLAPLRPFGTDSSTLFNSNAYSTALAAFVVVNGRHTLDWTDLTYAMDLNAMNSSITPLTAPVQRTRPQKWLNWDAARVLDMVKGSYLFDEDPQRILTDPDSLRASAIRQGAAWQAWAVLRDDLILQMNSSDHNPSVLVDLSPDDSWELSTPQMMQYYVKGGRYSQGKHGYIVASANWDPYPLVNDLEAFTSALENVAVVVEQRIFRFNNPFFTGVASSDVSAGTDAQQDLPQASPMVVAELGQEIQMLSASIPAEGIATDSQGNGDIESQAAIKVSRALEATDLMMHLLGQDVLTSTYWLNLRKVQHPSVSFGPASDAAWQAFRTLAPSNRRLTRPAATEAYRFVLETSIDKFYFGAAEPPRTCTMTLCQDVNH